MSAFTVEQQEQILRAINKHPTDQHSPDVNAFIARLQQLQKDRNPSGNAPIPQKQKIKSSKKSSDRGKGRWVDGSNL